MPSHQHYETVIPYCYKNSCVGTDTSLHKPVHKCHRGVLDGADSDCVSSPVGGGKGHLHGDTGEAKHVPLYITIVAFTRAT